MGGPTLRTIAGPGEAPATTPLDAAPVPAPALPPAAEAPPSTGDGAPAPAPVPVVQSAPTANDPSANPPAANGPAPAADVAATDVVLPKETEWVDTTPPAVPGASPDTAPTVAGITPAPAAPPPALPPATTAPAPLGETLDAMLPKPTVPQVADPLAPSPDALPTPGPNVADLPSPAAPVKVSNPSLRDTATIVADGRELVLYGIEGRSGEDAEVLQKYISGAGGTLECRPEDADRHVCTLPDGTDIAKVALVNGIASYALGGPQEYRDEEEDAQKARRGLWAELPPLPPEIDHPTMPDTATIQAPTGETLRLDGIEGMSGPMATTLQGYIAANGDSVQCQPQGPDTDVCILRNGTDIAKVALVNGLAKAAAGANTDYMIEQAAAKANRRGVWAGLSADAAAAANADMTRLRAVVVANVDTVDDGYTVVDGQPTLVVDGAPVFLVFAGAAGWGYWDHGRHWHGAPDRFAHRLEALHPHGEGLRGWSNPTIRQAMATARPAEFGRGVPVMVSRVPVGLGGRPGTAGLGAGVPVGGGIRAPISGVGFARPGRVAVPTFGGARPGFTPPAMGGVRPGFAAPAFGGARPGFTPPAMGGARPGFAAPAFGGARPGLAAPAFGGVRPGGGGFAPRPVMAAPRPAMPAPRPMPHR
jgi:endonuclease YncB( thermonuclease family)